MTTPLRFGPFTLDRAGRRLLRDGAPVELNARYFDALALLAATPGELITKDRFMAEVWAGIPVTDEALTQCIRTLRRALDDDAAAPRYIQTVPKYGYRFVASEVASPSTAVAAPALHPILVGGTLGGVLAGGIGGMIYGFAASALAPASVGGASLLLVLLAISVGIAALGAAGVSLGMALAQRRVPERGGALAIGGAAGGLAVGALTELVGTDAFMLLVGSAPAQMTGAGEGAIIGGAIGLALWLAARVRPRTRTALTALIGAASGLLVTLLGGRMFAGSLASLGESVAGSRFNLGRIGAILGETGFGPLSQGLSAMLEGALFAAAICWTIRRFSGVARP